MIWRYFLFTCLLLNFYEPPNRAFSADDSVDFARDIRPLLSDRCFICHGPDAAQRSSDLRLDDEASAHALAITAGDAEASELIRRIYSEDVDERMPPPESNLRLTAEEKNLLRRWIDAGGNYSQHWAFVTPRRPQVPQVEQADWPRDDLDRFVLARLEQERIAPSSEADRETLIRRVSLDLTGLPPTPAEVDAFRADSQVDANAAYERLVDRLLASKRYGERLAVDWLDVARYADTYGYQNDRYRAMWPWRDWVVRAFNQNLAYDDFITWQLAGDLLPQPTRDQILATAFNRNHRQTNEGGSVEEEFRAEYVADRVNTFGAAFLGLTLECCRCHDHKYDPLTQREYYQFAAFFNNIDESGLYSHFTEATPTPTLLLASDEQQTQLAEVNRAIALKQQQLKNWAPDPPEYASWRATLHDVRQQPLTAQTVFAQSQPEHYTASEKVEAKQPPFEPRSLRQQLKQMLRQSMIGDFPLEQIEKDKHLNRVDDSYSGKVSDAPTIELGRIGSGLRLSGENNIAVPTGGDFTRNQPFTISLWIKSPQRFERAVIFHRSRAWTDSGSRGYELLIEEGRLSAALVHFWPGNALRIVSRQELPLDRWVHVAMRYDGSSAASGLSLFVDGELADVEIVRDKLTKHIKGSDGAGGDVDVLEFGQRFRDVGFKDGCVDEIRVFDRDLSELELRTLYLTDALPDNVGEFLHNVGDELLRSYFVRQQDEYQQIVSELRDLRDTRSALGDTIAEIMVMREQDQRRPTHVLSRGAYDAPGQLVDRGTPASILPRQYSPSANRYDLAKWLVDPQHPLTARVAVNRFWQSLFGQGLVRTPEDFGRQGESPSNPELLDWLSVEFVESGWDVKRLLKTIVMSATYRQSSDARPELIELDADNTLLARGQSIRLSAEMIRDAALLASGLLVEKIAGPPVKPYQPDGLWEEKSGLAYKRDVGEGSHRRSLYTYWKRTSPPPAMMTLDASNREVCVVHRQVTMTPLQTLVLWNDPQYVEAARALGERAMQSSSALDQRLGFIFRWLTSRQPTQEEIAILERMFREQLGLFERGQAEITPWLAVGDHRPSDEIDLTELAALSVVSNGLMSFDETVMKR